MTTRFDIIQPDLSRLRSQLMVSDLKTKDNPTFQVIDQLIAAISRIQELINEDVDVINNLITNPSNNVVGYPYFGEVLDNDLDSFIPGPTGPIGSKGEIGPIGLPGIDGNDGEDSLIPGPIGLTGLSGSIGPTGETGSIGSPGLDGLDGEDSFIPGPVGLSGATGPTGSTGATGLAGLAGLPGLDGLDGEDGIPNPVALPPVIDGVWTDVPYASGNFTGSSGTWTVDLGDQTTYAFMRIGKTLWITFRIESTSVSGSPAVLQITLPNSMVAKKTIEVPYSFNNNNTGWTIGTVNVIAGQTIIRCLRDSSGTPWSDATNLTGVIGTLVFEIQ
jgi:hypothetical protein